MFEPEHAFRSRRSPILARRGLVATSQPLAAQIGLGVLERGGNAADAAVATAAALNVVEPCSTGIGGDCFALFFEAATGVVHAVNGSGRSPGALTRELLAERGLRDVIPPYGPHSVTVPGAAAGWADTVERHGRLPLADVLAPATTLARDGHPVSPIIAHYWERGAERLRSASPNGGEVLLDGRAPRAGEIWRNPHLADVFEGLGREGKDAFYRGAVAERIVRVLAELGGVLKRDDLAAHHSTFEPPISTRYRGHTIYECAPNGQGLTALLALNILDGFDRPQEDSVEWTHLQIEALRLAFADARYHVTDPAHVDVPVAKLLSQAYTAKRRALIDPARAATGRLPGLPSSDTVYLSVVDGDGNACSFINSNYHGFGTAIVPRGCGFTLQNRGSEFSLDPSHPNALEPNKRPYHTIIPAMSTRPDGSLHACFGVMGGYMQPQGHVQVLSRLLDFGRDPQAALDAPRFALMRVPGSDTVFVEPGLPVDALRGLGHDVETIDDFRRTHLFGRGQIIVRDSETGVLWGGSDGRADGAAVGY